MLPQFTPKDIARFWSHVNKNGPIPGHRPELGRCWVWTASRWNDYGSFEVRDKRFRAHRVGFMLTHGPLAPGECVLHSCDNPLCVNPAHLWKGTQTENMADMLRKGRHRNQARGERIHGAFLTEDIVRNIRQMYESGTRICEIRDILGLNYRTIQSIVYGHKWKHVT